MPFSIVKDVIVYSNSFPGVIAAIAAADRGASVAIVSPESHMGGMTVNGLSATDQGRYGRLQNGYLMKEFFDRYSALFGGDLRLRLEPRQAERILQDMMSARSVVQFPNRALATVNKTGTNLNSFTDTDGNTYSAARFIDGFYEGDLIRACGVTMLLGRESAAATGEDFAGFYPDPEGGISANPFDNDGITLLWGLSQDPGLSLGDADPDARQPMAFRVPMTKESELKLLVPMPDNYDPNMFKFLSQNLNDSSDPISPGRCSYGKTDLNFDITTEIAWVWNESTLAERAEISETLRAYQQGWLYYLQNDPTVPLKVQHKSRLWGLCRDEFRDNGYWPREAYVRDWARMDGTFMFTWTMMKREWDQFPNDVIAMGSYGLDCHKNRVYLDDGLGQLRYDGASTAVGSTLFERLDQIPNPYHIPYGAILPKAAQLTNVLSVCAISCTANAMYSYRMEPTAGRVAAAAGVAVAMSISTATPLHSLTVGPEATPGTLQYILASLGQIMNYTPPIIIDPDDNPDLPDDDDDDDDETGG